MSAPRQYPVTDGHDWSKPPVATVRVTQAIEDAMLSGTRFYLDPIIQLLPERKVVGFSLVPVPVEEKFPRPGHAQSAEAQ